MNVRDPGLYRANVGLALFHADGRVFLGRRVDAQGPYQWQMPQGGVDEDEEPRAAALRELEEEVGVASQKVRVLEEMQDWLYYDFPPELRVGAGVRGRWRGQRQKWFALRFLGNDADVRLDRHEPEFSEWKWTPLEEAPALVIPFKRAVYEEVARRFMRYATGRKPEEPN
jgi:putative (di)nucleoside polyphosphate hydrolase